MKKAPSTASTTPAGRTSSVRAPSAAAGIAVAEYAAVVRQSTSRHQAATREPLAMIDATAMMGTACFGPYTRTSAGIRRIDVPKPTMPPSVPATRPRIRTSA